MKKRLLLILLCSTFGLDAQPPTVKLWDYRYGGIYAEEMYAVEITSDSGFIMGGYSDSDSSGNVSQHTQGNTDFWVIKTNRFGLKEWDKRFGGTNADKVYALVQTNDGGYLFGGYTESDSTGDMSQQNNGQADYWIVRTDALGNKLWDKRFGGSFNDFMTSAIALPGGNFLIGGTTYSDSTGDMSHYLKGFSDYWIIKIDSAGNKLWDNNYGGHDMEIMSAMLRTADGGFVLGGSTLSDSTDDVSQATRGGVDYWIIKIDSAGNKLWDKRFGGDLNDWGQALHIAYDGGLLVGGHSFSDNTGDVSQQTFGQSDYWLVKTTANGVMQWNRRYGGDLNEQVFCNISNTLDGNYVISGLSYSYMSGEKTEDNLGPEEPWYLKINTNGNKIWDKTIFTSGHEESGHTFQTYDSCYTTVMFTPVDVGGYKSEPTQGFYDFWHVKLCDSAHVTTTEYFFESQKNIVVIPNPVFDKFIVSGIEPQDAQTEIKVHSISGQLVFSKPYDGSNEMINISNLPKGVYVLEIRGNNTCFRKKIIKL